VATQTNPQTNLKSNAPNKAPNTAPNAVPNPAGAPPGVKLDAAALSAGVQAVMGEEASGEAKGETKTAAAVEQAGSALVSSSPALDGVEQTGLIERNRVEARLPVQLDVGIPIRDFRVKNLLMLQPGSLIESYWAPGEDVPVASGEMQLAWSEFEVVDTQLAVRLTRLT
jgi:flagellar motor switch/type III secretory pathway protein FliN